MQFRASIQSSHSVYSLCPKFKITILTTSIRDGLSSLAYHNFAFATGKKYCELSDNGHKDLSNGCPKKLVAELPFIVKTDYELSETGQKDASSGFSKKFIAGLLLNGNGFELSRNTPARRILEIAIIRIFYSLDEYFDKIM
eukprot:861864_1